MTLDWRCPHENGWFPKLSRLNLACGNRAIFLADLVTGATQQLPGVDGYPHGWLSPTMLLGTRLLADENQRHLLRVSVPHLLPTGDMSPLVVSEDSDAWTGLLEVRASAGHWAAWDTQSRIIYDGGIVGSGYHGVRQHGEWVAARNVADDFALHRYHRGVLVPWSSTDVCVPKRVAVYDWAVLGTGPMAGTVVYGYPQAIAAYPDGTQRDVSRSPWGEGSTGGGGVLLLEVDGEAWLWSVGQIAPGQWGVLGGVLGEPEVIALDLPAAQFDVEVVGEDFLVTAFDSTTKTLRAIAVPVTTERRRLEAPTAPPPPPPEASVSLDQAAGPVPLTVTAHLTAANLTTWRWLLDDAIDTSNGQPSDGQTHVFRFDLPGTHTIGLRTSPAVEVVDQTVTATPARANPCGVQMGFGDPVGVERLRHFKARGWQWMRIGTHHRSPDRDLLAACIQEVVGEHLSPFVCLPVTAVVNGATVHQGEWVPDGLDIEYSSLTPDPTEGGQESDNRGEDPVAFAAAVDAMMPYHRAHGHRVWAPALSNPSKTSFAWLRRFVAALQSPDVGISVHRYPDYGMKRGGDGRRGFHSFRDELLELQRIIAERPWIMSEGDWHTDWMWMWQGDFFKWFKIGRYRLTNAQVVENTVTDWAIMRQMGCVFMIWYQVGQAEDAAMGEGLLDAQGRDKPQIGIAERVLAKLEAL